MEAEFDSGGDESISGTAVVREGVGHTAREGR